MQEGLFSKGLWSAIFLCRRPMFRPWSQFSRRRRGSFFFKGLSWNSGFVKIYLRVKNEYVLTWKWMTMPMLFGEIPLSESRKGFADSFVGSEWGRASRDPPREARGKRPMLRPWSQFSRRRRGSFLKDFCRRDPFVSARCSGRGPNSLDAGGDLF